MNRFEVIGNLTRDPELATGSEKSFCRFTVAVNRIGSDKADFFDFTAFSKLGENIAKYCKKGNKVYVEARAENNNYETAEGEKRKTVQFVAHKVEYLTKNEKNNVFEIEGEIPFEN